MDEALAREILKEDQEAMILRVRGYVANYLGVAPEKLGPVLKEESHVGEKK